MEQASKDASGAAPTSWRGAVASIHIAPAATALMTAVSEVRAIPGKGLEGDRYLRQIGTFSNKKGPAREVTLIEIEALEALKRDYQLELEPGNARRNIVTRGVPLNQLVGREFRVGETTLRGIRLCEPCSHLARLTVAGVERGLAHRGGLRAQVVTTGVIRVGDAIQAP
jgi:MOSC domain-containing protein YiiM